MTADDAAVTIDCSGDTSVNRIEVIHDRLSTGLAKAVDARQAVAVDCSAVTETDVGFIQLLIAARTGAVRRGIAFGLMQPLAEPLRNALERGGFTAGAGVPSDDFWTGGL